MEHKALLAADRTANKHVMSGAECSEERSTVRVGSKEGGRRRPDRRLFDNVTFEILSRGPDAPALAGRDVSGARA